MAKSEWRTRAAPPGARVHLKHAVACVHDERQTRVLVHHANPACSHVDHLRTRKDADRYIGVQPIYLLRTPPKSLT